MFMNHPVAESGLHYEELDSVTNATNFVHYEVLAHSITSDEDSFRPVTGCVAATAAYDNVDLSAMSPKVNNGIINYHKQQNVNNYC